VRVSEIMTREVITVSPETPIHEVARLIFDRNLTGMPVVDGEGKVVGIITEYDLMSRSEHIHLPTYMNLLGQLGGGNKQIAGAIEKIQHLEAKDVMTAEVVTVTPYLEVEKAADIFASQHINPLPVVEEGRLVGIVSRADIVKLFKKIIPHAQETAHKVSL
jgi:CBS domain-containing protein